MKILFIGNSHTHYNGLPFQLRELMRNGGSTADVAMITTGGVTLGWHATQPATCMAITYQDWDYIVLQQKSHPFDGEAALRRDCRALRPFLRKSRAEVLLYMTWPEKKCPEDRLVLDSAFANVAPEIPATLVPVSAAWCEIQQSEPGIELYDADQQHAAPAGTYLAACVFYASILKRSPLGLPGRIVVNQDTLVDLSAETAGIIQRAAQKAAGVGG